MELKEEISKQIDKLNATEDKNAALNYFKTVMPDLTRKKLNALRKSEQYPFEFASALFQTEFVSTDAPPAGQAGPHPSDEPAPVPGKASVPPARVTPSPYPSMAVQPPQQGAPAEPAFEDEFVDGTRPGAMPVEYAGPREVPGTGTRVIAGRQADITVADPRRMERNASGPVQAQPPLIDINAITEAVKQSLLEDGWIPPETTATIQPERVQIGARQSHIPIGPGRFQRRDNPQQPVTRMAGFTLQPDGYWNTASGQPPVKGWNESPQAFQIRMQNGG